MFLELRVVVVAVDLVDRCDLLCGRSVELLVRGVEQLSPVLQRERLGPPQVRDVRIELGRVALQPRQLGIVERGSQTLVQVHRHLGVQRRELVPGPPGSRVQQDPRSAVLVGRQLDEVVPRPERPELRLGPLRLRERCGRRVARHPRPRGVGELRPALAHARGDRSLAVMDPRLGVFHGPRSREIDLPGRHAAPDIDADRRRDHRRLGRDHRPDRGPVAEVSIGHQRDGHSQDGQQGSLLRLLPGLFVQDRSPRPDPDPFTEYLDHHEHTLPSRLQRLPGTTPGNEEPLRRGAGARKLGPTRAYGADRRVAFDVRRWLLMVRARYPELSGRASDRGCGFEPSLRVSSVR